VKRILREPLLHFLAIGALMFAVYSLVGDRWLRTNHQL
jgi:hypothetical protein